MFKSAKDWGYIFIAIAAISWGTEAVLAKLAYGMGYNATTLLFVRFFCAAVFFNLVYSLKKAKKIIPRENWKLFAILMAVQITANVCLYKAIQHLSPSLAILFFYMYPPLTNLINVVIFKEKLVLSKVLAIALAFCGLFMLYGSSLAEINSLGMAFAMGAAVSQAVNCTITEKLLQKVETSQYNSSQTTFIAMAYLIYILLSGDFVLVPTSEGIGILCLMVVFTSIIPYYCFSRGIQIIGSTDTSIICFLEIPSTVLFSYLVLGDILYGLQIAGALLIITGSLLPNVQSKLASSKAAKAEINSEQAGGEE